MTTSVITILRATVAQVTCRTPDGESVVDWDTLHAAAKQDDARLRAVYSAALQDAKHLLRGTEQARIHASVVACSGHRAATVQTRGYTGSVAVAPYTEENRAAAGNICDRETCRCGAERYVNRNGRHEELGVWRAPTVEVQS